MYNFTRAFIIILHIIAITEQITVKHKNFKGYIHFLEFSCCLVDMATSRSCYSVDQVFEFLDESMEDEVEDEPCMEGSDDEYDDLVDTSNNTDSYFDECDENMSMSSAPTDSIFTSPSTSHVTGDTQLAQVSNNLLPSTPISQQNPSHIQLQTSIPVLTNTPLSTLASPSNQPLTTHWSTNLHPVILNSFSGISEPINIYSY